MTWQRRLDWIVGGIFLLAWADNSLPPEASYIVGYFLIPTLVLGWAVLYHNARLWRRAMFLCLIFWAANYLPPFLLG